MVLGQGVPHPPGWGVGQPWGGGGQKGENWPARQVPESFYLLDEIIRNYTFHMRPPPFLLLFFFFGSAGLLPHFSNKTMLMGNLKILLTKTPLTAPTVASQKGDTEDNTDSDTDGFLWSRTSSEIQVPTQVYAPFVYGSTVAKKPDSFRNPLFLYFSNYRFRSIVQN